MNTQHHINPGRILAGITLVLVSLLLWTGCMKKSTSNTSTTTYGPDMVQVNLVADNSSFGASHVDPSLVNAWGIAISPNGKIWVSSTGMGLSTIYDGTGTTVITAVTIPSMSRGGMGSPTGQVFNSTAGFVIPGSGKPGKFIFAGLDGSITAWNGGATAEVVASKAGASYTGLALATDNGKPFLYAADNNGGVIDVIDSSFQYVSDRPFTDPDIPADYKPYNIQEISGMLYVTYMAMGAGGYNYYNSNGYIDVFDPSGVLVKRFASGGDLDLPWGITLAPSGMGLGSSTILVGNFGNGHILAYDISGKYLGMLQSGNAPLFIPGLWALVTAPAGATTLDQNAVYFSAGPGGQMQGLVGYIKQK